MIKSGSLRTVAVTLALGGALAASLFVTATGTKAATPPVTPSVTPSVTPPVNPDTAIVRPLGSSAQHAARAFWTPERIAAAVNPVAKGTKVKRKAGSAPAGTPTAVSFHGVPTIGALFFMSGNTAHFCTASVVDSSSANLIITAAHCVYTNGYASNIAFVPDYHNGEEPYGVWVIRSIAVAAGWRQSHNPNLDFAFLTAAEPPGAKGSLQHVTGGLRLGVNTGYSHPIKVVGYNDTQDAPVQCSTKSFKFRTYQMEFYCHDYTDGTSGGPWVVGYNGSKGTGTVIGVIGGFETGGNLDWASYSAQLGTATLKLFRQAEKA